jgi:hypothetical protein
MEMATRERESAVRDDAGNDDIELTSSAIKTKMADRAIGVFVHESELLKMDFLVSHPVVKVRYYFLDKKLKNCLYIRGRSPQRSMYLILKCLCCSLVDGLTGQLVEKSDPARRVTSYYEGTQTKRRHYSYNVS